MRKISVNYGGFPTIDVTPPFNWSIDPYKNKQWSHNFFSLRWLPLFKPNSYFFSDIEPDDASLQVLNDFISYHQDETTAKHSFYKSIIGDLATAVRVALLVDLIRAVKKNKIDISDQLLGLLHHQIKRDVDFLMKVAGQRIHNHDLNVSISVVKVLLSMPELDPESEKLGLIEKNIEEQQ